MNEPTHPTRARWREYWRALKGDGCTAVPDLGFTDCCNNHDRHYRTGRDSLGRPVSRLRSDWLLFLCMIRNRRASILKRALVAPTFFIGVRLGGWMHFKNSRKNFLP